MSLTGAALRTVATLLAFAPLAHAQPIRTAIVDRDAQGNWVERLVDESESPSGPAPSDTVENYDNWRTNTFEPPGNTEFFSSIPTNGQEIGDDLSLVNYSGGVVDAIGYTRVNMATSGVMTDFILTVRFYELDNRQLIDSFTFRFLGTPTGPGESRRTFFGDGALRAFDIDAAQRTYMTLQYSDVVGIDARDVGLLVGGPINTGSSSQFIRNFSTGQDIDLGSSRQANLGLFVKTVAVPAPTSASLGLALGVVFGARRRRLPCNAAARSGTHGTTSAGNP